MNELKAGPVLVVSARWQTRALLAAELGERLERDVLSAADVKGALKLIKLSGIDPVLVVVDAGRRVTAQGVERLLQSTSEVPLVLVVSRLRREAFDGLRQRCADYLVRPVRIGTIARAVVEGVEEDKPSR